jgi:hypothetical protein
VGGKPQIHAVEMQEQNVTMDLGERAQLSHKKTN